MKLLIMQFPTISRHFISLRTKYSPQHPVLKHPQIKIYLLYLYLVSCINMEEGPGIFSTSSRPVLGPTKHPIQCVPYALFLGYSGLGVKLTTYLLTSAEVKKTCFCTCAGTLPLLMLSLLTERSVLESWQLCGRTYEAKLTAFVCQTIIRPITSEVE
jgi:hypothetical protein